MQPIASRPGVGGDATQSAEAVGTPAATAWNGRRGGVSDFRKVQARQPHEPRLTFWKLLTRTAQRAVPTAGSARAAVSRDPRDLRDPR